MAEGNSRVRLGVVGIMVIALFGTLFARLWFLQISTPEGYAAATEANRVRVLREPADRGAILDRNGAVLVQNQLVDSIQVQRGITPEQRRVVVPQLARVLGLDAAEVRRRLDSPRFSPYEPVTIADRVPYEAIVAVKEHPELFPMVDATRRSVRVYPNGALGSHLLGYVGALNKQDVRLHRHDGYAPDDVIGKDGIEQIFESALRGRARERKIEVDSRGRYVGVLRDRAPRAGYDVRTTVDLGVQKVLEESLTQGMAASGAKSGAAVVLDARDGSVVALASAPTYDVSKFASGIPLDEFRKLQEPTSNYPLLDRVTQGQYAPGSTFKLIPAIAALEQGITRPEDTIYDDGIFNLGKEEFKNAGKIAHGVVNLPRAITVSSDVYFYNLGLQFWKQWQAGNRDVGSGIQVTARKYGFGRPTGVGLANEAAGRVPDEQLKVMFNKDNPDPASRIWLPGDDIILAVGQGDMLVTPMQLATAYATFANGGTLYAPRVASAILAPASTAADARVVRELPPQKVGTTKLLPEVRDPILQGLVGAVSSGEGTAHTAFRGYEPGAVAGKTGTAEVKGKNDTALFVGFSPPSPSPDPNVPQYVIAVVVEQGGFGGSVAAPIARRVFDTLRGDPNPPSVRLTSQRNTER